MIYNSKSNYRQKYHAQIQEEILFVAFKYMFGVTIWKFPPLFEYIL
jgi:hypothetical protein